MPRRTALIVLATAGLLASCSEKAPPAKEGLERPRPSAIRADLEFLADDLLEGRATGTRGYLLAARFVAARFAALGLEPAGDEGGYLQAVPLRRLEPLPESSTVVLIRGKGLRGAETQTLLSGRDYALRPHPLQTTYTVDAPVVFAGWGVSAPELGHDDYEGLDVYGKVVVVLGDAPPHFPSAERAHHSNSELKAQTAARGGAVALLRLSTPADERRLAWQTLVRYLRGPGYRWLDNNGRPNGTDTEPSIGEGFLSPEISERLFEGASLSWPQLLESVDAGTVAPTELPVALQMVYATRHRDETSPNVAALLPGSDPELAGEVVVYSAHLDHEGIGEPREGDVIYNGAVDNASGIASLLEIARIFALGAAPPRRSVLFLAVTAEELGLLGSDYFARYPTIAPGQLAADINLDGSVAFFPLGDVIALGNDHSSLASATSEAARMTGLTVTPDPEPEQNYFVRSDQYSFVRRGVPSVYIYPGYDSTDSTVDGTQVMADWMAEIYHSPADDASQPIDYDATAHFTGFAYQLGKLVADADTRPCWNPGDYFGDRFATEATRCATAP